MQDITDPDISGLLKELEHATGIPRGQLPFLPHLILCLHPSGAGTRRIPLHPSRTVPGALETPIAKIESAAIREVCAEIAATRYESLELHVTKKLMTYFNRVVLDATKRRR